MFFEQSNGQSPINKQDLIWVAEYNDGIIYPEFNFDTMEENIFYSIERDKLVNFGLIGNGNKFYYDINTGSFMLNGHKIDIQYKTDLKTYDLTGGSQKYNDIIQFKDAETNFNPFAGQGDLDGTIIQYNFGYKTKFMFDGIEMSFRAICSIPCEGAMFMQFRIVSSEDLNGKFIIRRQGFIVDSFEAPLTANVGGMLNWEVH